MLKNEFVTFSQNFLDRCGNYRSNQKKISDYLSNNSAKFLIYWKGKIPVTSDTGDKLCLVGREHPLVLNYSGTPIFLGFESGIPFFSIDISSWLPEHYNDEAARAFFDTNVYNHPELPENSVFAELRGFMNRISAQEAELAVKEVQDKGVLIGAGFIAGESLMGVLLAIFIVANMDPSGWFGGIGTLSYGLSLIFFAPARIAASTISIAISSEPS